jgi:hypothetical protein
VISASRSGICASIAARIIPPWVMLIAASRAEPERITFVTVSQLIAENPAAVRSACTKWPSL